MLWKREWYKYQAFMAFGCGLLALLLLRGKVSYAVLNIT
jgi:hypothetical protein